MLWLGTCLISISRAQQNGFSTQLSIPNLGKRHASLPRNEAKDRCRCSQAAQVPCSLSSSALRSPFPANRNCLEVNEMWAKILKGH